MKFWLKKLQLLCMRRQDDVSGLYFLSGPPHGADSTPPELMRPPEPDPSPFCVDVVNRIATCTNHWLGHS